MADDDIEIRKIFEDLDTNRLKLDRKKTRAFLERMSDRGHDQGLLNACNVLFNHVETLYRRVERLEAKQKVAKARK